MTDILFSDQPSFDKCLVKGITTKFYQSGYVNLKTISVL